MISTHIHKLHLYRRKALWASGALLLCSMVALAVPYQHRASHKLRATALLELTTDASGTISTRLIPITILDQGRFRDASVYESKPRPMALENGVVYEAQKSGLPVGYVTISNGQRMQDTWIATGRWQPAVQVAAAAPSSSSASGQNASSTPESSANDGDRPRLHRGGNDNSPPPASPSSSSGSDSDRPILHRSESPQGQASPAPDNRGSDSADSGSTESDHPDDPNRPVLRRRGPAAQPQPSTGSTSSASQPSGATAPSSGGRTAQAQTISTPSTQASGPGVQTFVAVSDAQPSDARSFDFLWKPGEQEVMEAKMRKLAVFQLPNETAQVNEHALTNVVIHSYDLDLSNDAVMVLTAEVPGGYLAKGGKTAPGKFVSRYITLIARVDSEGNPQRLAVSVTDSSQLDIAPRLELIDAVDVDGDGLGELLFREYGVDQKSFIVYGLGHGTITKVFEGASQNLQ
jgi:hypothetical protein